MTEELQPQSAENFDATAGDSQTTSGEGEKKHDVNAELVKKLSIAERKLEKFEKAGLSLSDTQQKPAEEFVSKKELAELLFFQKNPELEPYKEVLKGLAPDGDYQKAIENDSFKSLYTKAQKADEFESRKSVLQTNPRIGKATDKMTEAATAAKENNLDRAGDLAVKGVIEAFEL